MGTLDGMSAVIAGGPAAGALMPPLGCVRCHAWDRLSPGLLLFSASCFLRSCLDVRRTEFFKVQTVRYSWSILMPEITA